MTNQESFDDELATLRAKYADTLPLKLQAIEAALQTLAATWKEEDIRAFHALVHKLHGTSGIYQFTDVSRAAEPIETLLIHYKNAGFKPAPNQALMKQIETRLVVLRKAIAAAVK